jgi:putative pyruvate formate lyase activating enzyme
MTSFEPVYLSLLHSGELKQRVAQVYEHLHACDLCGWGCGRDRRAGKLGVCRTDDRARLSSYGPHHGEENPLRGWLGSGTIFFARCNMSCQFCQNHDISQTEAGELVEPEELAAVMLELQSYGCHNINLVSPTHVMAPILAAVLIAAQAGLRLPLVYNTGGFDSLAALRLLDGVVDIYMPDMKYGGAKIARTYSRIPHYPQTNQAAVREMHRQVGDLQIDEQGLATHGLLVRHLVLPYGLAGSRVVLRFLAEEISTNTYLNLMDQYRPAFNACKYPKLIRPVSSREYQKAVELTEELGLHRLDRRRPAL